MHLQGELGFAHEGSEKGYTKWIVTRQLAVEVAAQKLNLPIGHTLHRNLFHFADGAMESTLPLSVRYCASRIRQKLFVAVLAALVSTNTPSKLARVAAPCCTQLGWARLKQRSSA
jgi:hypothetical protein